MDTCYVLRIPRSDTANVAEDSHDFIIVKAASSRPNALALELDATEGTEAWHAKFSPSQLASGRASHSPLSPSEWSSLLFETFVPQQQQGISRSSPEAIPTEPTASSRPAASSSSSSSSSSTPKLTLSATLLSSGLEITFRHDISGITQRLGALVLPSDAESLIDPLELCSIAVLRSESLQAEVEASKKGRMDGDEVARRLQEQLEELGRERREGERKLLGACKKLLDSKKGRIRDLMRELQKLRERAGVWGTELVKNEDEEDEDEDEEEEDEEAAEVAKLEKALPSRRRKRKPTSQPAGPSADSESESGFEEAPAVHTPDHSDDETETASEDDEVKSERGSSSDLDAMKAIAAKRKSGNIGATATGKGRAKNSATTKADQGAMASQRTRASTRSAAQTQNQVMGEEMEDEPPPRRELPFARKTVGKGKDAVVTGRSKGHNVGKADIKMGGTATIGVDDDSGDDDDDDDEESDDEL